MDLPSLGNMISHSFLTLALCCFVAVVGCSAQTLDGGSTDGASSSSSGSSGSGSGDAISSAPLAGSVGGRPFEPRSIEIHFSTREQKWFFSIDNYENTCGSMKTRPDPSTAMTISMSLVTPGAGTTAIAYGDGHGATFQIGVYETSGQAETQSAETGTLRFDSWDETPGAQITGALQLEGGNDQIEGTFTATVCAAR